MMDFFQHRYYRITKILMSIIGQWPEQTIRARRGSIAVILFLSISQYSAVVMAFIKYCNDWVVVLDCVLAIGWGLFCLIKLFNFIWNSKRTLKLLNHIRADWLVWAGDREINILHEYAMQGRKYAVAYTVTVYSVISIWVGHPIVLKIIDVLLNNGSKPGKFPYTVYFYNLDAQKYYIYLMIYMYISMSALFTINITNDVMLIVYAQHGCGVFAALGHKLQRIGSSQNLAGTEKTIYDSKQMNKYANHVNTFYSWIFFMTIVFRIVLVIMLGLQIIARLDKPQHILRFGTSGAGWLLYVYMQSYLGQALMDYSTSIHEHIQNSDSYILSSKAQKLLLMMTMRSNVPCALTGGSLFTISLENFTTFLKTSVSYLTFLRSL